MMKAWNSAAYDQAVRDGWKAPAPKPIDYCACKGFSHRQHCSPRGGPKDVWCGTCQKSVRPSPALVLVK